MDLQASGTSKFSVDKTGNVRISGYAEPRIWSYSQAIGFSGGTGSYPTAYLLNSDFRLSSSTIFGFSSGINPYGSSMDVTLVRDAAANLAQRDGTNAQTFRVYNTYTNDTNYERAFLSWSSNELLIGTDKLGTGVARPVKFQTSGTTRGGITASGNVYVGSGAGDLATSATDGFLYLPTCSGAPTGTPSSITGTQPVVIDRTTNAIYTYGGTSWSALPSAKTVLSDTVSSTTYTGTAPSGSATSASVWKVYKTVVSSSGAITSNLSATNIKWNDRLTATYA